MIITLSHQKGGTGKSLIAWNLLAYYETAGKKVILCDLDIQTTCTFNNQMRVMYDLEPFDVRMISSREELIDIVNAVDDDTIIIFDVGGFDSDLNRMAIYASDIVVTPVADRMSELYGLKTYENIIRDINEEMDANVTPYVLVNNVNPLRRNYKAIWDLIENTNIYKLLDNRVRRYEDFEEALAKGMGVVELNKRSEASGDILALVNDLEKIWRNKNEKN